MKRPREASLSLLLSLLILTGSGCAEPAQRDKRDSVAGGTTLNQGTGAGENPGPAEDRQAGAANDSAPLLPRGLKINPPPANNPPPPPSPPSPPGVTAPPVPQPKKGAINPGTGEYYPPVPGGVINPRSGEVLPKVNGGYINPQTGEFIPAEK